MDYDAWKTGYYKELREISEERRRRLAELLDLSEEIVLEMNKYETGKN